MIEQVKTGITLKHVCNVYLLLIGLTYYHSQVSNSKMVVEPQLTLSLFDTFLISIAKFDRKSLKPVMVKFNAAAVTKQLHFLITGHSAVPSLQY